MHIGLVTDSLADMPLEKLLVTAAGMGIAMLEFGCGNWSSAPHLQLDAMLESAPARTEFLAKLRDHGLSLSALNCSGNPLHPGETGAQHREVTSKTIRLARLLGVDRVVMMSGCPGGPGDANANWVTTCWPPEVGKILAWQWDEVLIPYWQGLVAEAKREGVERLCLELHGHQNNVYNVATLHRLRDAVGAGGERQLRDPRRHLLLDGRRPDQPPPACSATRSIHVHSQVDNPRRCRQCRRQQPDRHAAGGAHAASARLGLCDAGLLVTAKPGGAEFLRIGLRLAWLRRRAVDRNARICCCQPEEGVRRSVELLA